jgi:RNA polymerase sigma factor for flagellar operon FliA
MSYDVDTLITNHLQVAKDIALKEWRTAPHALSKDDLLADAYLGLVDAANRWKDYCAKKQYDPEAVQYFKVFASLRIRGTIRDQIRRDDWATRTLRTKSKILREAGQDEGLTVAELAAKTEMSEAEINKVNTRMAQRPVSLEYLNARADVERDNTDRSIDIKNSVDTESESFANSMNGIFVSTVRSLPNIERLIIVLKYYSNKTLPEIAEELGMAEEAISTLHQNAVFTVRDSLALAATERV